MTFLAAIFLLIKAATFYRRVSLVLLSSIDAAVSGLAAWGTIQWMPCYSTMRFLAAILWLI